MTANLEKDNLVIRILHMPHHMNLITGQFIAYGEIEMIRISLHRLCIVVQAENDLLITFSKEPEVSVTCETMTSEMILLFSDATGVVANGADNREQYRRAATPISRIALPEIFLTTIILDALKLCSVL